jgi:hypothetical protein
MGDPTGEVDKVALRLDFDRRVPLQFRGSTITSDAGLLAYRELDDTLGLTDTGAETLADARTVKNGRHRLAGLLRQSLFGRPAGYEDVNDAERLCRDPAMRWVVGDRAITGSAASASQMGRFEKKWLSRPENLAALADLPGQWIDKVHRQRPPKMIVLDMDSLRALLERQHAELLLELLTLRQVRRNEHESLPAVLRRVTVIERHLALVESPTIPRVSRRRPLDG